MLEPNQVFDDSIELNIEQIEYILLKSIKSQEQYLEQETQRVRLVVREVDQSVFEQSFKQKINLPDGNKLYSVKIRIEEEKEPTFAQLNGGEISEPSTPSLR